MNETLNQQTCGKILVEYKNTQCSDTIAMQVATIMTKYWYLWCLLQTNIYVT